MSDPARDAALTWLLGTRGQAELIEHLTPARQEALKPGLERIAALPREQRVAFAAREARRLSSSRLRRGLEGIDPSWIVEALRGESPTMVAAALVFMPTPVRRKVLELLPKKLREMMPNRAQIAAIDQVWLVRVRDILDRRIQAMLPTLKAGAHLDVAALEGKLRDTGRIEAAIGLYRVGRAPLAQFVARMAPEHRAAVQEELKGVAQMSAARIERAERFWGRGAAADQRTDELHLRAGLWQLAHVLTEAEAAEQLRAHFLYLPSRWVRELETMAEKVREPEEGFAQLLLMRLGLGGEAS